MNDRKFSWRGKCEICGEWVQKIRLRVVNDIVGLICDQCYEQLRDCQVRRFCSAGEETEPGE